MITNFDRFTTDELIKEIVRRNATESTTCLEIFINEEGYSITPRTRYWESLKKEGIAMKNVFGNYIKEPEEGPC